MTIPNPGPLTRLLTRLLGPDAGEAAAGDLAELHNRDRARIGRIPAAVAHAWRLAGILLASAPGRPTPAPNRPPGDGMATASLRDLRHALHGLKKGPGLTATITLGVGLAVTTVVFALVWQSVLRPLPFPDPGRLDWLGGTGELTLTQEQFARLQPELAGATELSAIAQRAFALTGASEPSEVTGLAVTPNHFGVFGVPPYLGRALEAVDAVAGAEPVVYLGYDLWRTRFGADSGILGKRVDLYTSAAIPMVAGAFTGEPHTVIGVLPPDYAPFGAPDVITALVADATDDWYHNLGELWIVGRRRPGVSPNDVADRLAGAVDRVPELADLREAVTTSPVVSLQDALVGERRPMMFAALGAAALILLIAGANVVTLLLLRLRQRSRELAIRRALGATRPRVVRQLLAEGAVLAGAATALGLVLAPFLARLVTSVLPHDLAVELHLFGAPLAVALAALLLLTLACGLLPALGLGRETDAGLSSRGAAGDTRIGKRFTQALVAVEIALALVVTHAAIALGLSLSRMTGVELGFDPAGVTTMRIAPAAREYQDADLRRAVVDGILERARALPGVGDAGAIHFLPIADGGPGIRFRATVDDDDLLSAGYRVITPDYLETMRIPVVAGRAVEPGDLAGSELVGLVNRALAARLWPGESAVGKTLYRANRRVFFTVVGVVGDVHQRALSLAPEPEIYLPLTQTRWASAMSVVVRGSGGAAPLGPALRDIVRGIDPDLPITRLASMDEVVHDSLQRDRLLAAVFVSFAALALGLGGIGVFAVAAAAVTGRRREIGVRMAVGATGGDIARGELKRSGRLTAVGLVIGFAGTAFAARLVAGLLYDVEPYDPTMMALVAGVLVLVVAGAVALPTWRATRVDPTATLRSEG